jgi:hypothetical protein
MASSIDILQEKKIRVLIGALTAVGGLVALFAFLNQRKHNAVQRELFALDKQIKLLQLKKMKNGEDVNV